MKKTNLKEVYIVRYADDFKILCKSEDVARKMYLATTEWLKQRLGLDVSEEKSKRTPQSLSHRSFFRCCL